jgi:hypothetical protein
MAIELPGFSSTLVSGEDLTGKQFHFVKIEAATGDVIVCAAVTDNPIGILQNNPADGQEALVMHAGLSKVSADAALTVGLFVGPAADGQAASYVHGTDTTKYIVGQVVAGGDAGAAGELASVLFNCLGAGRGA